MKLLLAITLLLTYSAYAQDIPCGTNTIVMKGITFRQVCVTLLDSGYVIDKKDSELQTVTTQPRRYPKRFNASYIISCRVKDSSAYFTVTFNAPPDGGIVRNEPSTYQCKKSGRPIDNIFTYPFMLLNSFVKGFGKEIIYSAR